MKDLRRKKISALYKEEVAQMLLTEIKDPRIGFITVTDCEVSGDLSVAKVKISVLGGDKDLSLTMHGLDSCRKLIQSVVARRLRLRIAPMLKFEFDSGVQKSIRIAQLLAEELQGTKNINQLPYVSSVVSPNEDVGKGGEPKISTLAGDIDPADDEDADDDDDIKGSDVEDKVPAKLPRKPPRKSTRKVGPVKKLITAKGSKGKKTLPPVKRFRVKSIRKPRAK
ncbi:MAG: 30S ribosome-binding factor RbfA [Candidatus Brocadiia bacterium]